MTQDPMPGSTSGPNRGPGDLLADRYRLIDLLQESRGGRLWRAHDLVLSRDVGVHLIASADPRADSLLSAARRSAILVDRRILRVLDAESRADICYVVTEWADGTTLDVLLEEGPLDAQRAAWIASEVGSALATAHAAGYAHGRLTPESVLIDASGTVRILGFAVNAALVGLEPGEVTDDVTDLAAILYAALTGRWPGRSPSQRVPAAPQEGGQVLRARQVRAGVPSPLDALCDQVLTPDPRGSHARTAYDLTTALGISEAVSGFVGDPTVLAQAEAAAARQRARTTAPISLPPEVPRSTPSQVADTSPPASPALGTPAPSDTAPTDTAERPVVPEALPEPTAGRGRRIREPESASSPLGPTPTLVPDPAPDLELTQAGVPIFHDDPDDDTEVSWFSARPETPAPPPPFEPPAPKPLFAPAPPDGAPLRRPRAAAEASTQVATPAADQPGKDDKGFWPWGATGTQAAVSDLDVGDTRRAPGMGWLRIAGIIAVTSLLLLAIVAAFNLGQGQSPFGLSPTTGDEPDAQPAVVTSTGKTIPIDTITDFDPQAEPPEERPDLVPLAFDGDPETAWRTETYLQNFGPEGLKDGLGLVVDLGESHTISSLNLALKGEPTSVTVSVSAVAPASPDEVIPVGTFEAQDSLKALLDAPAEGRYVTLWLTSLPAVDGGFQAQIAEVVIKGE